MEISNSLYLYVVVTLRLKHHAIFKDMLLLKVQYVQNGLNKHIKNAYLAKPSGQLFISIHSPLFSLHFPRM